MNSESTIQSDRQEFLDDSHRIRHTTNYSQMDHPFYMSTQTYKYQGDRHHLSDFCGMQQIDNSCHEEDSKDEDSFHQQQHTEQSNYNPDYDDKGRDPNSRALDSDQFGSQHKATQQHQYQTQGITRDFLLGQEGRHHQSFKEGNSRDKGLNLFSNSFDEGAHTFDTTLSRPQRNCKSSTRMMNKTYNTRPGINPQIPIPILHNHSSGGKPGGNGILTAGSLNRKQATFNSFLKTKQQLQNQFHQTLLSQMQRANTQNSFDTKAGGMHNLDLSNRSMVQTAHATGQAIMNNSFYNLNQYLYGTQTNPNKPITPHTATGAGGNSHIFSSVILSAGGSMNPRNSQGTQNQSSTMDPQTYLRWKQQKYKSCRSIQATNNGGAQLQNIMAQQMTNSQYHVQQKKGNQTQKNINKSTCSSNGSTSMTVPIKSLSEVKNPQYFIQFRFNDRKVTDLSGISQFKNLSELNISGNLLTEEIQELKQLTFLKKLNLSNNTISDLYQLPQSLEILNISYNCLKRLNISVIQQLKNLTTLDISNNGMDSLEGIENIKRLKRLLAKNNQVTDLSPLNDIETLIEIDLENNPIDSYQKLVQALCKKKDILVVNLKLAPVMLTISSFDQLIAEIESSLSQDPHSKSNVEVFKKKLKLFSNGCLYRSKRAYLKIRAIQQHSKRSSSNFSNGSSSCGRAGCGVNTGGRTGVVNAAGANFNVNTSSGNAFSPLLHNQVTTPNNNGGQHVTQRLEDIEQIYDEILDEEEELERKLLKIQKKKQKKQAKEAGGLPHPFEDDSGEEDEDESLDEEEIDEDDLLPQVAMSFEDDLDDLQSYRQNANMPNEFLNESTADFNKEIKQINQELREQLGRGEGADLIDDNTIQKHLQSVESQQSIYTNSQQRKNPISFKLDLSKCRQQSQDEDEDIEGADDMPDPECGQLEIPGLQFVKVTEDSFRQFQKQQSNLQSMRQAKAQNQSTQQTQAAESSQKYTLRDCPPAPQINPAPIKQVFIPKLQLGALTSNKQPTQQQQVSSNTIPIKTQQQQQTPSLLNSSKKQVAIPGNTLRKADEAKSVQPPQSAKVERVSQACKNTECLQVREDLRLLKLKYEEESKQSQEKIKALSTLLEEIKSLFKFAEADFTGLTLHIKAQQEKQDQVQSEKSQMQKLIDDLNVKYQELDVTRKQSQEEFDQSNEKLMLKCQENEKTIAQLREQISMLDKVPSSNDGRCTKLDLEFEKSEILETDLVKRTQSQQQQLPPQLSLIQNNPSFFYNHNASIHQQIISSDRHDTCSSQDGGGIQLENMNERCRKKKITCDIRKIKRPSSVIATGQRRSSHGIKINSLLKLDPTAMNQLNLSSTQDGQNINEYHTQQHQCDDTSSNFENATFSQTMNRKVGHYIQRLKERNSSLQERLNGSFGGSVSGTQSALQRASPLNLNLTQQQDGNPYILSPPSNGGPNQHFLPATTTNHSGAIISSFTSNAMKKVAAQQQAKLKDSPAMPTEYSSRGPCSTDGASQQQAISKQHSKTQRININRVQYCQLVNQNKVQYQIPQLKDSAHNESYQSNTGCSGMDQPSSSYQMGSYRMKVGINTGATDGSGPVTSLQKAVAKVTNNSSNAVGSATGLSQITMQNNRKLQ